MSKMMAILTKNLRKIGKKLRCSRRLLDNDSGDGDQGGTYESGGGGEDTIEEKTPIFNLLFLASGSRSSSSDTHSITSMKKKLPIDLIVDCVAPSLRRDDWNRLSLMNKELTQIFIETSRVVAPWPTNLNKCFELPVSIRGDEYNPVFSIAISPHNNGEWIAWVQLGIEELRLFNCKSGQEKVMNFDEQEPTDVAFDPWNSNRIVVVTEHYDDQLPSQLHIIDNFQQREGDDVTSRRLAGRFFIDNFIQQIGFVTILKFRILHDDILILTGRVFHRVFDDEEYIETRKTFHILFCSMKGEGSVLGHYICNNYLSFNHDFYFENGRYYLVGYYMSGDPNHSDSSPMSWELKLNHSSSSSSSTSLLEEEKSSLIIDPELPNVLNPPYDHIFLERTIGNSPFVRRSGEESSTATRTTTTMKILAGRTQDDDLKIRLFSLPDCSSIGNILLPKTSISRNEGLFAIAISPNGKLIAAGRWDGTIEFYSLTTKSIVASVPNTYDDYDDCDRWGHLAFTPYGDTLIATTMENAPYIYTFPVPMI